MTEREMLFAIRAVMLASPDGYGKDSCIAATALTKEYLAARGFDGDGIQVQAALFNEVFLRRQAEGMAVRDILKDPDAYSVGIGYDGGIHVVYLGYRGDETVFVDLSLDQASRPLRALPMTPYMVLIERASARRFMHGGPLTFVGPARSLIAYRRIKKERFRKSPNWTERDAALRRKIIEDATELLKEVRDERP